MHHHNCPHLLVSSGVNIFKNLNIAISFYMFLSILLLYRRFSWFQRILFMDWFFVMSGWFPLNTFLIYLLNLLITQRNNLLTNIRHLFDKKLSHLLWSLSYLLLWLYWSFIIFNICLHHLLMSPFQQFHILWVIFWRTNFYYFCLFGWLNN